MEWICYFFMRNISFPAMTVRDPAEDHVEICILDTKLSLNILEFKIFKLQWSNVKLGVSK